MKRSTFCLWIVIAMTAALLLFMKQRAIFQAKNPTKKILQLLSPEEKSVLSNACKELFYLSPVGYTLFGDKPLSLICLHHRRNGVRKYFFFNVVLPFFANHQKDLVSSNYAILFEHDITNPFVYVINKRAFVDAVEENISIFRKILGERVSPQTLLDSITSKKFSIEHVLKENEVLWGILFGYGTENALLFDRRDFLDRCLFQHNLPPKKGSSPINTMDQEEIVTRIDYNQWMMRKVHDKEDILPFNELEKELSLLSSKTVLDGVGGNHMLSSLRTPSFVGDPTSKETLQLMQKYVETKKLLIKLMAKDDFFEKVVEQFFSTEGE